MLRESICSLKEEVTDLRNAIEEMSNTLPSYRGVEDNHPASDENWRRVSRGRGRVGRGRGRGGGGRQRGAGRSEGMVGGSGASEGSRVEEGAGKKVGRSSVVGAVGSGDEGCSRGSHKKKENVCVEGAHRVWGTMKVTTSSSLIYAVSRFCNTTNLLIKRKTVCDYGGRVNRWWFVIHASENVLLDMEAAWEQLQLQTGWKLEPCFSMLLALLQVHLPVPSLTLVPHALQVLLLKSLQLLMCRILKSVTTRLQYALHLQCVLFWANEAARPWCISCKRYV